MKRKKRKPMPNARFCIREWHREAHGYNISNPDPTVLPEIDRIKREAYKELRESS